MCLALPMQIVQIDGTAARCVANGIEREISLYLLPPDSVRCGEFVMVHVGYAIQTVAREDAELVWGMVDAMYAKDGRDA